MKHDAYASVLESLSKFEEMFGNRSPVFFPEYTDHSTRHIEEVLDTAVALVRHSSLLGPSVFTPEDAAALSIGVLVHDAGMYLTEDGFHYLIDNTESIVVPDLDMTFWSEAWESFLAEAKHWDGVKLRRIFGDTDPIRRPPRGGDLSRRDRLLIGEFVRRTHGRMAHELAVVGVPGVLGRVSLLPNQDPDFCDLAGAIARSHSMPLRKAVEYVGLRFHRRAFKHIHAPFLMGVLRVADYLQIQPERAPGSRLLIEALRSPLSRDEWKAHEAVRDVSFHEDDPECAYVHAVPDNVATFLKLRDLLSGLQFELDTTWAVLGEVYGRDPALSALGLTLRRVRSNLDSGEGVHAKRPYIPVKCALGAAPSELLSLLVEPLYAKNFTMAIRELVQNAADACLERIDINRRSDSPESRIRVALNDVSGRWILTVSDNGIGMTVDTVQNYFLKAGASFRRSEAWRREHADDDGRSRVVRSGRFGIGILSAFMLGETIRVRTRHHQEPRERGIEFAASLSDDLIELVWTSAAVGTTIEIELKPGIGPELASKLLSRSPQFGELPSNLYLLAKPRLDITVNGKRVPLGIRWPYADAQLPPTWRRIAVEGFRDVQWNYSGSGSKVACNGIAVRVQDHSRNRALPLPNVSIFDADATLPLNLARTEWAGTELPFADDLYRDIVRDLIAWVLTTPMAIERITETNVRFSPVWAEHPAVAGNPQFDFVVTEGSFTLCSPWALWSANIDAVVQECGPKGLPLSWPPKDGVGMLAAPDEQYIARELPHWRGGEHEKRNVAYRHELDGAAAVTVFSKTESEFHWDGPELLCTGERAVADRTWHIYRPSHKYRAASDGNTDPLDHPGVADVLSQTQAEHVVVYRLRVQPDLTDCRSANAPGMLSAEINLEQRSALPHGDWPHFRRPYLDGLSHAFVKYLGPDIAIPTDVNRRIRKFASAYAALKDRIRECEELRVWKTRRLGKGALPRRNRDSTRKY